MVEQIQTIDLSNKSNNYINSFLIYILRCIADNPDRQLYIKQTCPDGDKVFTTNCDESFGLIPLDKNNKYI